MAFVVYSSLLARLFFLGFPSPVASADVAESAAFVGGEAAFADVYVCKKEQKGRGFDLNAQLKK